MFSKIPETNYKCWYYCTALYMHFNKAKSKTPLDLVINKQLKHFKCGGIMGFYEGKESNVMLLDVSSSSHSFLS
jgi:hypothetical protein